MARQNPWLTQVEYLDILVTQVQLHHLNAMVFEVNLAFAQVDLDSFDGLQLGPFLLPMTWSHLLAFNYW